MLNTMNTSQQYEEIKQMWWYQKAEHNRLKKIFSYTHWWVIVWQKSKKWVECVKCDEKLKKPIDNYMRCKAY